MANDHHVELVVSIDAKSVQFHRTSVPRDEFLMRIGELRRAGVFSDPEEIAYVKGSISEATKDGELDILKLPRPVIGLAVFLAQVSIAARGQATPPREHTTPPEVQINVRGRVQKAWWNLNLKRR